MLHVFRSTSCQFTPQALDKDRDTMPDDTLIQLTAEFYQNAVHGEKLKIRLFKMVVVLRFRLAIFDLHVLVAPTYKRFCFEANMDRHRMPTDTHTCIQCTKKTRQQLYS